MSIETVESADGERYAYRLVASRLERRASWSRYWSFVHGEDFLKMMPHELRYVADVLENSRQAGKAVQP